MKAKILKTIYFMLIVLTAAFAMLGIVKGGVDEHGVVVNQDGKNKVVKVGSPFESSGSTSRYALTEAIVEDGTFFLSDDRAKFASPDVAKYNDHYLSLFNPGVSFLGIPFYILGKHLGFTQIVTYFSTTFFALANTLLILAIARKVGAKAYTALLSGLLFLFGTNALAYSLTYTQHHASTFVILLATLVALGKRTFLKNLAFGILYGLGLMIDIPNGIILLPCVIYIFSKQITLEKLQEKIHFSMGLNFVGLVIGLIPLLVLMGWYNLKLTGSYIRLPQFVGRTSDFWDSPGEVEESVLEGTKVNIPFNSRNLIKGLNVFFLTNERNVFLYAPVIFLGLWGYYLVRKRDEVKILFSVVLMNVVIYMLFNDATGGWSFGPRYLIPGMAIVSSGVGVFIQKFRSKKVVMAFVILVVASSVFVNVLGAMTTILVPPKAEAVIFANPIPYTYQYNWQLMIDKDLNSSLLYNMYISRHLSSFNYAVVYSVAVMVFVAIIFSTPVVEEKTLVNNSARKES